MLDANFLWVNKWHCEDKWELVLTVAAVMAGFDTISIGINDNTYSELIIKAKQWARFPGERTLRWIKDELPLLGGWMGLDFHTWRSQVKDSERSPPPGKILEEFGGTSCPVWPGSTKDPPRAVEATLTLPPLLSSLIWKVRLNEYSKKNIVKWKHTVLSTASMISNYTLNDHC